MTPSVPPKRAPAERERLLLLVQLQRWLALPMSLLGIAWLFLVVLDLTRGLSPFLEKLNWTIWGLFVIQFALELWVAPRKRAYLRRNWLAAVALLVPALRVVRFLRVARAVRALRGARLLRVVSSANRGMRSVARVMGRRGLGYVVVATLIVNVAGAAGIHAFERDVPTSGMADYGTALWWTAMTLTTMGADYFPRTAEGRLLGLLLAIYGFAVFGYVTASIASLFVARDAESDSGELAGAKQVDALRAEVAALSEKLDALVERRDQRT